VGRPTAEGSKEKGGSFPLQVQKRRERKEWNSQKGPILKMAGHVYEQGEVLEGRSLKTGGRSWAPLSRVIGKGGGGDLEGKRGPVRGCYFWRGPHTLNYGALPSGMKNSSKQLMRKRGKITQKGKKRKPEETTKGGEDL